MAQGLPCTGTELPALMTSCRWQSPMMPARYAGGNKLDEGRLPDIMGSHKLYDEIEEGYAATQNCDWRLNPWVCNGSSKLGNDQSCLSQVPLSAYVRVGVVKPYHLQCSPGDAGRASRPLRSADTRYDRYAKSVTAVNPGAGWGRIEIVDPNLPVGEAVDVTVRHPSELLVSETLDVTVRDPSELPHRSAVDILEEAPGQRIFKTPADVESYLNYERASWSS